MNAMSYDAITLSMFAVPGDFTETSNAFSLPFILKNTDKFLQAEADLRAWIAGYANTAARIILDSKELSAQLAPERVVTTSIEKIIRYRLHPDVWCSTEEIVGKTIPKKVRAQVSNMNANLLRPAGALSTLTIMTRNASLFQRLPRDGLITIHDLINIWTDAGDGIRGVESGIPDEA